MPLFVVRMLATRPRLQLWLQAGESYRGWHLQDTPSRSPNDSTVAEHLEDGGDALADPLVETDNALIWDVGSFETDGDLDKDLWRGKVSIVLDGYRLRGRWVLGRNKGTWRGRGKPWIPARNWTLVKYPDDEAATENPRTFGWTSVLCGRDPADFTGARRSEAIAELLRDTGAKRRRVPVGAHEPMTVGATAEAFDDEDYLFEVRLGGLPVTVAMYRGHARITTHDGDDVTAVYPDVAWALEALGSNALIAQGEITSARPREPVGLTLALHKPATLHLFDLFACGPWDLRAAALRARKEALATLIANSRLLQYCDHIEERGLAVWEQAAGQLPAGGCLVARNGSSIYAAGTSEEWLEIEAPHDEAGAEESAVVVEGQAPRRTVKLSNTDKVFWPQEGYTKGQLLAYYEAIAPFMLPYLRDRAVVLNRFVDGIEGRAFFQHHAPGAKSSWLRTVRIRTSRRPRDYFLIDDVEGLLYLVNLATIPFHLWHSRVQSLDRPDWCIVDVDRSESSLENVIRATRAVHEFCERAGLPHYVKTSGGTGMHVMIPLGGDLSFDQSRLLSELICQTLTDRHPDLVTTEGTIAKRGGRIYLDALVNARGRMIVSPFSVRAKPGATVSMPVSWEQLDDDGFDPARFTILTAPDLAPAAEEAWAGFWNDSADLQAALARLGA